MPCILTRCRAFFLPGYNTATHERLQRVLPCKCNYTDHATKQRTGLYRGFSGDYTSSTDHDTTPTQAAIIPPAPRWSVSQRRSSSSTYQIPPPRRDAAQVSATAYYNKVYKRVQGCALLWIHAKRCSISQTIQAAAGQRLYLHRVSPAGSRCFPRPAAGGLAPGQRSGRAVWHPPPGGAVQRQGHGGRRGTIGGSRRISFRAFAR